MTTTISRPPIAPTTTSRSNHAPPKPASTAPGRRNRSRIALGAAILAVCVLGATTLYARAAQRADVITVRRAVAAGQAIERDDLETRSIAVDANLRTTRAADMASIVGKTATVALAPGTLLAPSQYGSEPRVPDGSVIVGAILKPGQYPVGLRKGDTVTVIETAPPAATGAAVAPSERGTARVADIQQLKDAGATMAISMVVPAANATAIASAGSAGRITVVVVGAR